MNNSTSKGNRYKKLKTSHQLDETSALIPECHKKISALRDKSNTTKKNSKDLLEKEVEHKKGHVGRYSLRDKSKTMKKDSKDLQEKEVKPKKGRGRPRNANPLPLNADNSTLELNEVQPKSNITEENSKNHQDKEVEPIKRHTDMCNPPIFNPGSTIADARLDFLYGPLISNPPPVTDDDSVSNSLDGRRALEANFAQMKKSGQQTEVIPSEQEHINSKGSPVSNSVPSIYEDFDMDAQRALEASFAQMKKSGQQREVRSMNQEHLNNKCSPKCDSLSFIDDDLQILDVPPKIIPMITINDDAGLDSLDGVPSKPKGPFEISDVHAKGCKLKWKAPEDDGGKPINHYLVENMDVGTGNWLLVGRADSDKPEMDLPGLISGKEYHFRVKAVNAGGESEPLITDHPVIVKNPFELAGAPGTPELVDWDENMVELKWQPPQNDNCDPITGYVIEKKERFGITWDCCAVIQGSKPEGKVSGLVKWCVYKFRVKAINKAGESKPSDPTNPHIAKVRTSFEYNEAILYQLYDMGFPLHGCQRALYYTQNGPIGTAFNWVMEHMEDADFSEPLNLPAREKSNEDFDANPESADTVAIAPLARAMQALQESDNNLRRQMEQILSHANQMVMDLDTRYPLTGGNFRDRTRNYFSDPLDLPATKKSNEDFVANPESVDTFAAMGFAPSQAIKALEANNNNLERALDWIFSQEIANGTAMDTRYPPVEGNFRDETKMPSKIIPMVTIHDDSGLDSLDGHSGSFENEEVSKSELINSNSATVE